MKSSLKLSLIAGLMVAAGLAYAGQRGGQWNESCDPMMGSGGMMQGHGMRHDRMGKMDPARMQAKMEQRDTLLKTQLKLTPAQEGAWKAFVDARKPMATPTTMQRPDPVEMAKLTTPERLDKMKALRAERMKTMTEAMEKHEAATKTFYAALTPDQQKVFDVAAMPGQGRKMGGRQGQGPAVAPTPAAKL